MEKLFEAAQAQMVKLLRDRQNTEREIKKTMKEMMHLSALLGVAPEDPLRQLGITDAIRHIVGTCSGSITASQIKQGLIAAGCDLPKSNPAAAIHTILGRLVKSREVQVFPFTGTNGEMIYGWIGKAEPPTVPVPVWMTKGRKKK